MVLVVLPFQRVSTSQSSFMFENNMSDIPDFDLFDPYDSVGDIMVAAIGLDWDRIREEDDDYEFECDVTLVRIIAKERIGQSPDYRVTVQSVYTPELVVVLTLFPEDPYNITLNDFFYQPPPTTPYMKMGKRASENDRLAKMEALYDYEVAALVIHSSGFLNTRNKAYKRA